MKHPFAVGIGVGAASVLVWWKRSVIVGWLTRVRHPLSGAAFDTLPIVQQLLTPAPVVLSPSSVQDLVRALRADRDVIDIEPLPALPALTTT